MTLMVYQVADIALYNAHRRSPQRLGTGARSGGRELALPRRRAAQGAPSSADQPLSHHPSTSNPPPTKLGRTSHASPLSLPQPSTRVSGGGGPRCAGARRLGLSWDVGARHSGPCLARLYLVPRLVDLPPPSITDHAAALARELLHNPTPAAARQVAGRRFYTNLFLREA